MSWQPLTTSIISLIVMISIVASFDSSNMGDGWSATQVEASASGGFEVFWSHTDGRTTAHKLSDTGVYQSTITRTIDQHEIAFQADLDGRWMLWFKLGEYRNQRFL